MDARAADQARAQGLDPGSFRARSLTPAMVAGADLVLTATRWHRGRVVTMYPRALPYTFALLDFADIVGRISPTEVTGTSSAPPQSRERVQALVRLAAASRGSVAPLPVERADVVDPYRRDDEFFERMAEQILGSLPAVVAALAA
jgi:protein-tyrosine phosphatase